MPVRFTDDDVAPVQSSVQPAHTFTDADVAVDHQTDPGLGQQLSDLFSHTWAGVSSAVTAIPTAIMHPLDAIDAAHEGLKRSADEIEKGKQAWKAGDHGKALAHWKLAVPIVGPLDQQMYEESQRGEGGAEIGDVLGFFGGAKLLGELPKTPGRIVRGASNVKAAAGAVADVVKNPADAVGNAARAVPDVVTDTILPKVEKAATLSPATQDLVKIVPGGSSAVAAANTVARTARNAGKFIKKAQGLGVEATPEPARTAPGVAYPGAQDPAAVQPRTPIIDTSTELTPERLQELEARRTAGQPQVFTEADVAPTPETISPPEATPAPQTETIAPNPGMPAPQPETIAAPQTQRPLLDEPAYDRPEGELPKPKDHYQAAARTVKARALARWLDIGKVPAADAAQWTPEQWHAEAAKAGVNKPSPDSIKLALDELRSMELKRTQTSLDTSTSAPGAAPAAAATLPADGGIAKEAGPGGSGDGSAASTGEGLPAAAAPQPGADAGRGTTTKVRVPGETTTYPAEYRVRELTELQPSHNGETFQPNPKYRYKNDRDYSKRENQAKVVEGATPAKFDPAYHITDNPDLTNGPPMVDVDGNALGGNGRTMQMQRVYASNPAGAAAYRELLTKKAAQFGLDPADIAGMKQPVLVREVADEHLAKPQDAITDVNKTGTAALTPAERAIADSRRVSPATLDDMAARLEKAGPEATLPKLLAGADGGQILEKLIDDGVITSQERAAYAADGKLTKEGQARITKLMLGRFFRDPAQLDTIPPAVKTKLERLAGPLAQLEGAGEWNLMPVVKEALDLLDEAHAHGTRNLPEFLKQSGLFGEQRYSVDAVTMAKQLQRISAGRLLEQLREYARGASFAAEHAHQKAGLFADDVAGEPPNPRQSFEDAFGYSAKAPSAPSTPATPAGKPPARKSKGVAGKIGDQFTKLMKDTEGAVKGKGAKSAPITSEDLFATMGADPEYQSRLDAERATAEMKQKSRRQVDAGKESIEDSPLFGGPRQQGLF